jgi:hypothetical protein
VSAEILNEAGDMHVRTTFAAIVGILAVTVGGFSVALAAPPSSTPAGHDISYPQCTTKHLPTGQAFGIVGVNGGRANNYNTCFSKELAWADASAGGANQPKAQLYVNTGNPGNLGVADWPKDNNSSDPYAKSQRCTGQDDQACAWQYGWNMAEADFQYAGPGSYIWWLDVETANSWELSTSGGPQTPGQANDQADLEGMVAYFQLEQHVTVGIYSTSYQWLQIVGPLSLPSPLAGLPNWIPGARTSQQAQSNCGEASFTPGSSVILTQWAASIDGDYSCVG